MQCALAKRSNVRGRKLKNEKHKERVVRKRQTQREKV
jgi:hypothetical protein